MAESAAFFQAVRVHDDKNQGAHPGHDETRQHRMVSAGIF